MPKRNKQRWEGCPIRFGMGIFGDKWTLLIVRDLMFKGKRYYGEFTDPEENIASNILADRLTMLVDEGIVTKQRDPDNKSRFIYELSAKGMDLLPMMLAMVEWSAKYDPHTEVPKDFLRKLKRDRNALMREIRTRR